MPTFVELVAADQYGIRPIPLLDAKDDARRVAEEILMGVDAIGQLREAVVGLDGPDCEVMVDGDVEASANERCQRARSASGRA